MITFEIINQQEIKILKDGKEIGQIFTPAGSNHGNPGCIQICGFTEAFDLWGCGSDKYQGFKDIQLAFIGKKMEGEFSMKCPRCYREPCQCENKFPATIFNSIEVNNPFNLKREREVIAKQI